MGRLPDVVGVARTVVRVAHSCNVKYPAAALAYYAFVSFVPLLLFVFAVVGQQFATEVAARSPRFLTPAARGLVYEALTAASGRTGAVLLAAGVLGWSGANVAVDFLTVVERVEDATAGSLAEQLRDGVVVLGALSVAIVTIVLTNVLFAGVAAGRWARSWSSPCCSSGSR
jgi:membrane protein